MFTYTINPVEREKESNIGINKKRRDCQETQAI